MSSPDALRPPSTVSDRDPAAGNRGRPLRLVVGCGYLGERVARRWVEAGSRVIATTRRDDRARSLATHGLEPAVVDVTAAAPGWDALFAASGVPATVFWAVGFDRAAGCSPSDVHVEGLRKLLDALAAARDRQPQTRVILSSSTGVWGDLKDTVVDESTPPSPSREAGRVLVEAEALLAAHPVGPGAALRFAGLYGPGRLPRIADLRAGVPIAADPDSWLNLIHVDDAAAAVHAVADATSPAGLYVVSDGHPVLRRRWYGTLAALTRSPEPRWDTASPRARGADKRVDSTRIRRDLGIRLEHPDAVVAMASILAAAAAAADGLPD